jgi:palmitoyltransferase
VENVCAVFGRSVLYWPFPIKETSSGLKFKLAEGEGKWIEFHRGSHHDLETALSLRERHYVKDIDSERLMEAN